MINQYTSLTYINLSNFNIINVKEMNEITFKKDIIDSKLFMIM